MQTIYSTLIKELHKYAKNKQYQRAAIGLSGGLDSAVALCIAIRAFGPKNVTALILPEVGLTQNDDINHAKALAEHFGVTSNYQPINNFLVDYNFVTWEKTEEANEVLKARIRGILLRHFADAHNALLIGTANKSDLTLGYGHIDGEFIGDIHVLGDLYKSQVIELAKFIGLPEELIEKAHSRNLKPNQTDEEDFGAAWSQVDDILHQLLKNTDPETLIEKGMESLTVHKVLRLIQQNENRTAHIPKIQIGKLGRAIQEAQEAEASSII